MKDIQNEKIFDLLASKSYGELNDKEKELVNAELNPSEYDELREVISDFKEIDNTIEVVQPNTIRKEQRLKQAWWHYKVPSYQVAAVLVVAVVSTFVFTKKSMEPSSRLVEARSVELDTLVNLKKSVNLLSEEYPSAFVINW